MLYKRRSAASTVFNEKTLWITGGYIGSQKTDTSEYVTLEGSKIGPSLPKALGSHAMAKINGSYSIVKWLYYNLKFIVHALFSLLL